MLKCCLIKMEEKEHSCINLVIHKVFYIHSKNLTYPSSTPATLGTLKFSPNSFLFVKVPHLCMQTKSCHDLSSFVRSSIYCLGTPHTFLLYSVAQSNIAHRSLVPQKRLLLSAISHQGH